MSESRSIDGAVSVRDSKSIDDVTVDGKRRTASWLDTCYHSVTARVGAGVLGLPAVMSSLGWAGGVLAILASLFVSWYSFGILVYLHEEEDLDNKSNGGWRRFDRYQDLTKHIMGPIKGWWALVPFQIAVCLGMSITYTVAGGDSLHAAINDFTGGQAPPSWAFYLMFGAVQIVLSLLPDFSSLGVVSLLGALMSFAYVTIAIVLSAMIKPAPTISYAPLVNQTPLEKVFSIFNALSTIMFAYGGHNMALEIQASLPRPPTVRRMLRGVHIAFVFTGIAYLCVAVTGFHALGNTVGDNIILALTNGPAWVRTMARLMVVVHVAAAFQVYAHPAFESMENLAARLLDGKVGNAKLGYDGGHWVARLIMRTIYALGCTLVACLLPWFGYLMGFVGAVAITPTTFLLPSLLWLLYKKPTRWGVQWGINWIVVIVTAVIGVFGAVGSMYLLVQHASKFKVFASA